MPSLEKKLIRTELIQRKEEGCDTEEISGRVAAALEAKAPDETFTQLYDELLALPIAESFPYSEPSTLQDIQAQRPDGPRKLEFAWDEEDIYNRVYGAWLGRAAGCSLGKPVEGWDKERIEKYLEGAGVLPLDNYIPYAEKVIPASLKPSTLGNIQCMARDDDMDFPILGLLALEQKGAQLTPRTMASTWTSYMPFGLTYTAEEVAYRNFALKIWPPESALHRNPFREWIGAQIRADIFGYTAPGCPERAAEFAYRDACISHVKNGIYGEMFIAAMIAAAFVQTEAEDIVTTGLAEIPAGSRLAEAIQNTQSWCREELAGKGKNWQAVWSKIHEHYGHYHGVHTINNAALVVMGLYFGNEDFEQGIVATVLAGWDTDCTGATVGSILGIKSGAKSLPEKWIGVLNDRLISAVRTHNDNKISDLAKRTVAVAKDLLNTPEPQRDRPEKTTLEGDAAGTWELDTSWGAHLLKLDEGSVYLVDYDMGPLDITASSLIDGELKFSFAIDKGGWDFAVDFEGHLHGDAIEGVYYPGLASVKGRRASQEQKQ
ncbi:MAG: ADP-ribosylglycohydrolase family protein [Pseudomonadales bacterium]